MRFSASMTALGFLLVAIAAGIWPSWVLASSPTATRPGVTAEASAAAVGKSAFRPCYSTVKAASVSCFPQLGLPQGMTKRTAAGRRHGVEAAKAPAMKTATGEAELRPPRSPALI